MQTGIGDSVRRKEDLRLLTGRGCYSDDFNFPGQAYAAALRAPHAHALIRDIDTVPADSQGLTRTGNTALADLMRTV